MSPKLPNNYPYRPYCPKFGYSWPSCLYYKGCDRGNFVQSPRYKGVVIFGNPGYYQTFGFKNAQEYNIQTSQGDNFDAFMVLELVKNGLQGISGRFYEAEAFKMDPDEFEAYEKQFPYKEKHKREGQLE